MKATLPLPSGADFDRVRTHAVLLVERLGVFGAREYADLSLEKLPDNPHYVALRTLLATEVSTRLWRKANLHRLARLERSPNSTTAPKPTRTDAL